jgi:hypothetical protein
LVPVSTSLEEIGPDIVELKILRVVQDILFSH